MTTLPAIRVAIECGRIFSFILVGLGILMMAGFLQFLTEFPTAISFLIVGFSLFFMVTLIEAVVKLIFR